MFIRTQHRAPLSLHQGVQQPNVIVHETTTTYGRRKSTFTFTAENMQIQPRNINTWKHFRAFLVWEKVVLPTVHRVKTCRHHAGTVLGSDPGPPLSDSAAIQGFFRFVVQCGWLLSYCTNRQPTFRWVYASATVLDYRQFEKQWHTNKSWPSEANQHEGIPPSGGINWCRHDCFSFMRVARHVSIRQAENKSVGRTHFPFLPCVVNRRTMSYSAVGIWQ